VPSPSLITSDLIQETSERLLVAIFNDDVSMLQALLNNAASPSSSSPSQPGPVVSRRKRVSVVEPPQPTLILNCLDANGYAPLHHAVMCRPPSIAVVEALYFAGADVNLRTAQGRSALHVLAQYATGADEDEFLIRDFVLNFVHQFKASFACVDARGETCLHVAAERGASPFVLAGLLLCDEEGRVRELKNARG
jgi:ankyrin repeat protein